MHLDSVLEQHGCTAPFQPYRWMLCSARRPSILGGPFTGPTSLPTPASSSQTVAAAFFYVHFLCVPEASLALPRVWTNTFKARSVPRATRSHRSQDRKLSPVSQGPLSEAANVSSTGISVVSAPVYGRPIPCIRQCRSRIAMRSSRAFMWLLIDQRKKISEHCCASYILHRDGPLTHLCW